TKRAMLATQIDVLWRADGWEGETRIAREAFYGWQRLKLGETRDAILATPGARLELALRRAIERRIIPDLGRALAGILAEVAVMRLDRGQEHWVEARLQLTDAESGTRFAHHPVSWRQEADETVETGTTDGRGVIALGLIFAQGDGTSP